MKKLEQLTKKELIQYITQIRPKADAYDRVFDLLPWLKPMGFLVRLS